MLTAPSIYEIPFEDEFDIALSIGVVHHLSEPEQAIQQLIKAVKPGGRVLIWVYGYENMELFVNVLNPLRKALFSRMPLGLVRALARIPTAFLWALLRCGFRPNRYFELLRQFPFSHLLNIVFDQMLPKIANYWTRQEAFGLLDQAGLKDVQIECVNEISWTVIGTKPS